MDILFVQHGDYGLAYKNMLTSKKETYRDQYRSVRFVDDMATTHTVRVLSFCNRRHIEQLTPSLWSIGIEKNKQLKFNLNKVLKSFKTDLLICRTPHHRILNWSAKTGITTLPCFADTFDNNSLKSKFQNFRLERVLKKVSMPCVANHSLNASRSLILVGVDPRDIVPWDWSPIKLINEPKTAPSNKEELSLIYIGKVSMPKGVDTLLEALAILKAKGLNLKLNIAGNGDISLLRNFARELGIGSQVKFLGIIPSDSVLETMRKNDIVIVPSKHEYPEGLPNTIYEALASRCPMIISDHPAFIGRLKPYHDCLSFVAGNANDLSKKILELRSNPTLYTSISKNTANALQSLYIGEDWCELISYFVNDPENKTQWTKTINLRYLLNQR